MSVAVTPSGKSPAPRDTQRIYSIAELAREFEVTARTIRFYEDEGLIKPRRQGTQRLYSAGDRARLGWILAGANLLHVPYNNNRQVTDVLAGDVPLTISIVSSVTPYTRAGRLRALAVAGHKRLEILPDVPMVSEVLPKFEPPPTWTALFAPPGLPKNILARLHAAVAKTVATPELRAKATADGFELIGNTPEEFSAQLKRDIEVAGRLVKAAKIEPTD